MIPFDAVYAADADFEAAVAKAVGQFDDSGQVCLAGTRLIVHSSIKEKFLSRFLELTAKQKLGATASPQSTLIWYSAHLII